MVSRSDHDLLYHSLAPAFLIFTPFINFVNYNDYSYTAPEIWICLAGLAAIAFLCGLAGIVGGWPVRVVLTAGLLVLWVDLQSDWWDESNPWRELQVMGVFVLALLLSFAMRRHLSRIVTAVFATMLGATVVLAAVHGPVSPDSDTATADPPRATATEPGAPARPQLPILVHLILDEHIGVEGISDDVPHGRGMRKFLREFFDMYGFRVFARAYSRYSQTRNSLPNLVNFSSQPVEGALTSGAEPYVLLSNRYFELLSRAGYKIHVYQIDYIDFCASARDSIVNCATRESTGITEMESVDMPVSDKVTLIYQRFADLSALKAAAEARYIRIRKGLGSVGWILPEWWLKGSRPGPFKDLALFADITAQVAQASPGHMFFVHLLLPHSPYALDAMCDFRPVQEWELPKDPEPMPNDGESRARRYELYFEQMRCLYRKLEDMFQEWQKAGIFDRLVLIVHGDHGSRISQRTPHANNQHKLSHADYLDGFSTLFAVKGPGHPPGYDRRVAAIEQLLGDVLGEQTEDDHAHREQIPYVFLHDGPARPMLRQPLPGFGETREEASKSRDRSF
jgi:hypothetical protein